MSVISCDPGLSVNLCRFHLDQENRGGEMILTGNNYSHKHHLSSLRLETALGMSARG